MVNIHNLDVDVDVLQEHRDSLEVCANAFVLSFI